MPKFVIERDIPGVSNFTCEQFKHMAQSANEGIIKMGSQIQWINSFITGDKVYSIYIAPNKESLQEHARQAGIPATMVSPVTAVIDPTTAE